jgi:hypothetical protein
MIFLRLISERSDFYVNMRNCRNPFFMEKKRVRTKLVPLDLFTGGCIMGKALQSPALIIQDSSKKQA